MNTALYNYEDCGEKYDDRNKKESNLKGFTNMFSNYSQPTDIKTLAKLAAEKDKEDKEKPKKEKTKKDKKLGTLQGAYVADAAGAHSRERAEEKITELFGGKKNLGIYNDLLVSSATPLASLNRRIRRGATRQAQSGLLRHLSNLDPTRSGEYEGIIGMMTGLGKKDISDKEKVVAKLYKDKIQKYQDEVKDPESGEITSRETPWHLRMQGAMADLDSDVAGHKYHRKETPLSYWLNPLDKTGPIAEINDRALRRTFAGTAYPESTLGRFAVGAIPFASLIAGGSDAQQKLRRAALKNDIYAPEARPDIYELAKAAAGRCWKGYEPVPGKEPYSEDSCRPVSGKKNKKQEKKAARLDDAGLVGQGIAKSFGQVGNILGAGGPLMVGADSMRDPNKARTEKVVELLSKVRPDQLKDVLVRRGSPNLWEDMVWKGEEEGEDLPWHKQIGGRILQNPRSGPIGKLFGYATNPISYLVANLSRGPHYNAASDTVSNYWDNDAVTEHELGHAIDFNSFNNGKIPKSLLGRLGQGTLRDLYGLSYSLPFVNLMHETAANRESEKALAEALSKKDFLKRTRERSEVLPAGLGSYIGSNIGLAAQMGIPTLPLRNIGAITGLMTGKVTGPTSYNKNDKIEKWEEAQARKKENKKSEKSEESDKKKKQGEKEGFDDNPIRQLAKLAAEADRPCSCNCGDTVSTCKCGADCKCRKEGGSCYKGEKAAGSPAWQRSEGKNSEGGLNAKGRASYNKSTGGNLKAPVTQKNPKGEAKGRKASFCARMGGMKKKLTGEKTKNDPDSRINKALRKWNC